MNGRQIQDGMTVVIFWRRMWRNGVKQQVWIACGGEVRSPGVEVTSAVMVGMTGLGKAPLTIVGKERKWGSKGRKKEVDAKRTRQ